MLSPDPISPVLHRRTARTLVSVAAPLSGSPEVSGCFEFFHQFVRTNIIHTQCTNIDPLGRFYRLWQGTMLALGLCLFVAYPLIGAFTPYDYLLDVQPTLAIALIAASYAIDALLWTDIYLRHRIVLHTSNGYVRGRAAAASQYRQSSEFKLDLLAVVPLEVLSPLFANALYAYGLFKCNRALKALKV